MRGKILFVVGLGVGYILGARAGREKYNQIKRTVERFWNDPRVQKGVDDVQGFVKDKAPEVADFVSDNAKKVAQQVSSARKSGTRSSSTTPSTSTTPTSTPGPATSGS